MTDMTVKNAAKSLFGRSVYILMRDTYGNARSITATSTAHSISSAKSFLCAAMYLIKILIGDFEKSICFFISGYPFK